jgi:hypothetical protein
VHREALLLAGEYLLPLTRLSGRCLQRTFMDFQLRVRQALAEPFPRGTAARPTINNHFQNLFERRLLLVDIYPSHDCVHEIALA